MKSNREYKIISREELMILLYDKNEGEWKVNITNNCGHRNFEGFHYFKTDHLTSYNNPENLRFLVCLEGEKVLGVMKIAEYELDENKKFIGLNYIDVHKDYRRQGIAKGLYNLLNTLPKETLFISSKLSDMGINARLNEVRKRIVTKFKTYDDRYQYYEEIYKNELEKV